jgi:hypothetical protein
MKRKNEIKVILSTFEIKKEVKIVIPTFAIKLEHVEGDEVMQKKVELNGITKLMQEYIDKYSNYIYYHWVQQLSLLKGSFYSNYAIAHRFPTLPT